MADEPMNWIILSIPFMTLAIAAAVGPIIWAIVHEARHGRGDPVRVLPAAPIDELRLDPRLAGVTVCAHCSSVVTDADAHIRAVHAAAA